MNVKQQKLIEHAIYIIDNPDKRFVEVSGKKETRYLSGTDALIWALGVMEMYKAE